MCLAESCGIFTQHQWHCPWWTASVVWLWLWFWSFGSEVPFSHSASSFPIHSSSYPSFSQQISFLLKSARIYFCYLQPVRFQTKMVIWVLGLLWKRQNTVYCIILVFNLEEFNCMVSLDKSMREMSNIFLFVVILARSNQPRLLLSQKNEALAKIQRHKRKKS